MNDQPSDKTAGGIAGTPQWSLKFFDRDFVLTSKATIGRAEGTEIMLLATGVSRKHATVEPTPDGVVVVDLGSKNGTYIGGRRIERGMARAGDLIKVGDVFITVEELRPEESETIIFKPGEAPRIEPRPVTMPKEAVAIQAPEALAAMQPAGPVPATPSQAVPEIPKAPDVVQVAPSEPRPPIRERDTAAPRPAEAPLRMERAGPAETPRVAADAPMVSGALAAAQSGKMPEPAANQKRAGKNWWEQTSVGGELGTMLGGRVEDLAQYDPQLMANIKVTRPTLIGLSPSVKTRRVELEREKYTIGRAAENDIVIDDQYVSSQHAQLVLENGSWFVSNMLASNGTFVNGTKTQRSILSSGDRIRVGGAEWLFKAPKVEQQAKPRRKLDLGNALYFVGGILLTSGLFLLILFFLRK